MFHSQYYGCDDIIYISRAICLYAKIKQNEEALQPFLTFLATGSLIKTKMAICNTYHSSFGERPSWLSGFWVKLKTIYYYKYLRVTSDRSLQCFTKPAFWKLAKQNSSCFNYLSLENAQNEYLYFCRWVNEAMLQPKSWCSVAALRWYCPVSLLVYYLNSFSSSLEEKSVNYTLRCWVIYLRQGTRALWG